MAVYCAVLNLPESASEHEVRERYRQLSIVIHPDKQVDEARKEAATPHFSEVQKGYEVLFNPVKRAGLEGQQLLQSADFAHVAEEDFEEELLREQRELDTRRVEPAVQSKATITLGVNVLLVSDDEH